MLTPLTIGRLYAGTVYKLVGIGLTCSLVPLSVLLGILAFFGVGPVSWSAKPLQGALGLALYPVLGVILAVVLTFTVGSACVVGLWLYSKFRPLVLWASNER